MKLRVGMTIVCVASHPPQLTKHKKYKVEAVLDNVGSGRHPYIITDRGTTEAINVFYFKEDKQLERNLPSWF